MSDHQDDTARAATFRSLNDEFRNTFQGGAVVVTAGIAALKETTRLRIFLAVQEFDDFDEGNDPWGEHDFGALDEDGVQVFFKIECYGLTRTLHAEDAVDTTKTERVMTIMLASEY